jgi:zinc protease
MKRHGTYFGWIVILGALLLNQSTFLWSGSSFAGGLAGAGRMPDDPIAIEATSPPTVSAAEWPHLRSDLPPDPQAIFGRLKNGFRYVVLPNSKPKDRVSLHLVVLAGSIDEAENQRGIAHFLEHMLFNGSTHFPPGELVKYFQKIGMQFGPDANARTGFYDTVYDISLPASDRQSLQEALLVMQDYAQGALLLQSEIDRERGVILAEKRMRDSADYRSYVASLDFELKGTRFPERLPIGSAQVIASANRPVFKAFYDTWYRPDNMVLVMVGDMDPDLSIELIEEQFGDMAPRAPALARPETGKIDHRGLQTFYHYEKELGSTSVTLQVMDNTSPPVDNAAFERRLIEEQLANRIIQNRLDRKINQAGSPATDANVGSGIFLHQIRYGYISADCQPAHWQAALSLVDQELRKALQYGFTSEELARVKKDYLAGLDQAAAQAKTRESASLARALIYAVTNDYVFRSPRQEKAFADPIVAAISADDLLKRLHAIWNKQHRLVLVSGNAAIAAPSGTPEEAIAGAYQKSQTVTVAPPVQGPSVAFPYLAPPSTEGRIVERQTFEDLEITTMRFANNIRFNFKPTDFTADEVQFALSFGQGRSGVPADKAAMAALADEVVNESGLGRLNKDALKQALAGKKTDMQFSVKDDRFVIEGRSTPAEIELMFQLLYAAVKDPAFREEAWQLALERYTQTYHAMRQSVDGVMNLYGWRFLSDGDPRFGMPPLSDLKGISANDVAEWIGQALHNGAMELSVVGDVDAATIVPLAARYLGSLPDREDTDTTPDGLRSGPTFPTARKMAVSVETQINKALLVMALPTDDIWDIERTRRLNILADIIADRLRLQIREKLGAAYSTGAFSLPSRAYKNYGLLVVYIPLAPDTIDMVEAEVTAILQDIRQKGISADELQRALEPTLKGIRDRFRENDYWLQTVLAGASRHPVQLDWSRTIMEDYAAIQTTDIERVARRYLDTGRLAVIEARAASTPKPAPAEAAKRP